MNRRATLVREITLDAYLRVVDAWGARVNNLFQVGDGWRCNLSRNNEYFEFGEGSTPQRAIQAALAKIGRSGWQ